jgi:hypothetical protein
MFDITVCTNYVFFYILILAVGGDCSPAASSLLSAPWEAKVDERVMSKLAL